MLLMPSSDIDFGSLAKDIAVEFLEKGASLTKGVADKAKELELTPEEIRRLVEKTNTAASVQFLASSEHKKGSFPLADYGDVLAITHPTEDEDEDEDADEAHKESEEGSDEGNVKDSTEANSEVTNEGLEKTSSLQSVLSKRLSTFAELDKLMPVPKMKKQAEEKSNPWSNYLYLTKTIEEAKLQKTAEELSAKDGIDYIISEFSKYNAPSFSKFASEAYCLCGKESLPVLHAIGEYLGDKTKLTKVAWIIDDTTDTIVRFKQVCTNLRNASVLDSGIPFLKKAADYYYEEAKRAYKVRA